MSYLMILCINSYLVSIVIRAIIWGDQIYERY